MENAGNNNWRNALINAFQNPWRTLGNFYNSEGNDESLKIAQLKVAGMCLITSFSFKYAALSTPAMIKSLLENNDLQWVDHNLLNFHAAYYLGCIVGVLGSMVFNIHNGKRKDILIVASAISLIGWVAMMVFSESFYSYLFGRFLIGKGFGLYSVAITYYVYESIYVNTYEFRSLSLINSAYGFIALIALTLLIQLTFDIIYIMIVGCCLHLIVLLILWSNEMFPESPYFLYRKIENHPEITFEEMIDRNTGFTQQLFMKIQNDVRTAKDACRMNIYLPLKIFIRFIMHEMTGITIYCSSVPNICEGYNITKFLLFLILMLLVFFKNPAKYFGKYSLMVSSTFMSLFSFVLGISLSYDKDLLIFVAVQYFLLMCCFYSYMAGWINSQSIIFDDGTPYYKSFNFVVPAMLSKFCILLILAYIINWPFIKLGACSIVFSTVSILAAVFHHFN